MNTRTSTYIGIDDLKGVLVAEYADFLLDFVSAAPHDQLSTIIFAFNSHAGDGARMIVHFEPLTDEQLSQQSEWARGDVVAKYYDSSYERIIVAAYKRWPNIRFFRVPGCMCCNDEEDLRAYDCELKIEPPSDTKPWYTINGQRACLR
jgi:hypothetical protein